MPNVSTWTKIASSPTCGTVAVDQFAAVLQFPLPAIHERTVADAREGVKGAEVRSIAAKSARVLRRGGRTGMCGRMVFSTRFRERFVTRWSVIDRPPSTHRVVWFAGC